MDIRTRNIYVRFCKKRIRRELNNSYDDPPHGICLVPDESGVTTIFAVITGTANTPYEGGFFNFLVHFPIHYPMLPLQITQLTTGEGRIRFGSSLHANGDIVLSILEMDARLGWIASLTLSSVLSSLQSEMNGTPYHNEPGYKQERKPGDVNKYNDIIRHETLRVAVCDVLEGLTTDTKNIPQSLRNAIEKSFPEYYEYYKDVIKRNMHLDGQQMSDPFGENKGTFDYKSIQKRIEVLARKYIPEAVENNEIKPMGYAFSAFMSKAERFNVQLNDLEDEIEMYGMI